MLKEMVLTIELPQKGSIKQTSIREETNGEGITKDFGDFTTTRSCGFGEEKTGSSYFIIDEVSNVSE